MEEIDIDHYCRYVQAYIKETTGFHVRIVFNDPMIMRKHFVMLVAAYDVAFAYYNKKN